MKKMLKRLCTGFLALATVVTALPTTPVHAESKQYWTESKERVGIVEKVMNDGSIGSTFNEGHLTVEGEDAYCIDINTDFKNGYKTRADASTRMSADQISDVALSIEYVKQENKLTIYSQDNGTNILLVIEDNGCGIKASDLSRVFEKGFTGSNRNKANATGMGLYLSKKLCDRLGLKLDIASTEKEYTRLTITFPKGTVHNFSE